MAIETYRDLRVWRDAMDLTEACYRLTTSFPADERYGLSSQIRRACVSIPANIAEGYGRNSKGSYIQFLRMAQGSLKELETHLLLVQRLALASKEASEPLLVSCDDLGRMLWALIRSLERGAG